MPQFDPHVAFPQIVWLIAVFAVLYLIVRSALPKVEAVVGSRAAVIGSDLTAAETARTGAAASIADYEAGLARARGDAARVTAEAKAAAAVQTTVKLKEIDAELSASTAAATVRLEAARTEALAGLTSVAEDAAGEMVTRLTGRRPDAVEVSAAVRNQGL